MFHVAAPAVLLVVAAIAACAPPGARTTGGVPEPSSAAIEIVPPTQPLEAAVAIRRGSFSESHASPEAMCERFREVLAEARVFAATLDAPPSDGTTAWDVVLTASDYGEPNAYTFELQAWIVRDRDPIASYITKQSATQRGRGQLTIGPDQLEALAERAIRDLVRQIAADTARLSSL